MRPALHHRSTATTWSMHQPAPTRCMPSRSITKGCSPIRRPTRSPWLRASHRPLPGRYLARAVHLQPANQLAGHPLRPVHAGQRDDSFILRQRHLHRTGQFHRQLHLHQLHPSPGTHTMKASAVNGSGTTGYANLTVTVLSNRPPVVALVSPPTTASWNRTLSTSPGPRRTRTTTR